MDWIDADAENDVNLNATADDLVIIAITADDDINLTTTAGSITDGNGATNNLMGDAVNFKVGGAITDIEITVAMISSSKTAAGDVSRTAEYHYLENSHQHKFY